MSRIRSIKPEFYTSEQIVECSIPARLLFIGLWTFSDDAGIHQASLQRIKMEVFPGDNLSKANVSNLINELKNQNLIIEYEVENKKYWQVTGWHHQRIDQPTYRYPQPTGTLKDAIPKRRNRIKSTTNDQMFDERSPSVRQVFDECSPREWSGEEGMGVDVNVNKLTFVDRSRIDAPEPIENCPYREIVSLYHELLPMCPQVITMTKARKGYLRQRWLERKEHQDLEYWREYFGFVASSQFLTGQKTGRDGKPPFVANLEWLVRPTNFVKVIEGNYHRE